MTEVVIVVRDVGRLKPDFSLKFSLPAVPRVGEYISIFRPDSAPHTEDLVVRKVWWRLDQDETSQSQPVDKEVAGRVRDIVVECDPAIGPYATASWRQKLETAQARGVNIARFRIERVGMPEGELKR